MNTTQQRHAGVRRALAVVAALAILGGCGVIPTGGDAADKPQKSGRSDTAAQTDTPPPDEPALDGTVFADPEGRYTLTVPADWDPMHGAIGEGIEFWSVGEITDDFAPNINVLTEDVAGATLDEYVQFSLENAPTLLEDFELIESTVVTGPDGHELAVIEYSGGGAHFLGIMAMGSAGSVVITLTTTSDRFEETLDAVYPYMLTVQPTEG
ncbi:DUF1795 domain-containing protein [Actinotalea subterranea]|uniref:DUF1795 domain-containing protein n=1 Tax=Actinotalea subterranea TaxID=2607497 RepID=UPI0011EBE5E2|nr:DUF1795 domain-containing protein [Actinotalea subterranea]